MTPAGRHKTGRSLVTDVMTGDSNGASIVRFAQARIVTADVSRLARFYEEVLGVSATGSDEYVELRTAGVALAICSQRAMDMYGARAAVPASNRSVVLDFEVQDVDAERHRLASLVPSFVLEPTTQPWGNRSALLRDPDGNLINLFSLAASRAPR
jgi:predicted enzyme related to lactoylglutathione lyase